LKLPLKCPQCGLTYDHALARICPYCGKSPHPSDCPDPLCVLDISDPQACQNCPRRLKSKRGWGGKRPGAGAPQGNVNHLQHGLQSKLMKKGISRLTEEPELRAILHLVIRLAIDGVLPPQTKKLILSLNPQYANQQTVKRLVKRKKEVRHA